MGLAGDISLAPGARGSQVFSEHNPFGYCEACDLGPGTRREGLLSLWSVQFLAQAMRLKSRVRTGPEEPKPQRSTDNPLGNLTESKAHC
jgi:hypothetical protein